MESYSDFGKSATARTKGAWDVLRARDGQ
jgi:hypothetical protein